MGAPYDGIILGTGHNALVFQAYLARSGLKVLSLDRAAVPGGGLATEENPRLPGFLHNTHSFFHRAITAMPWYKDLALERHGAVYVEPELNVAFLLPDGRSLEWWLDFDRTVASFADFSKRDAAVLQRWVEEVRPMVERIIIPEVQSPPLPLARRRELLGKSALGRRFLEVSARTPLQFVEEEFKNEIVRAGLLFFNGMREIDLRAPGFGHSIPALLAGRHKAQLCLGGSAQLAKALVAAIREHGGEVRTGAEPRAILCRHGRAVGVELKGGERIEASSFIASGLNPQQTFLDLLDADAVMAPVRAEAAAYKYNKLAPLFALNLALSEPPRYLAAESRPELNQAFMLILGLERMSQFSEMVTAHESGAFPPTIMWGACPTLFDPSQAPSGRHTAFMWEKMPYALHGDPKNWDREQEAQGKIMLDMWSRFAPNIAAGAVLDAFTRSPLDTERNLPNMRGGDLLVGSLDYKQIGYNRPFAGAGQYRTPLAGLYLCGASTHPGGNITGLCGYNAAAVVAADLGLPTWWNPPQVERAWQSIVEPG
jgi:phytoene dehydrogenase-like protein